MAKRGKVRQAGHVEKADNDLDTQGTQARSEGAGEEIDSPVTDEAPDLSQLPTADEVAEKQYESHKLSLNFWTIAIGVIMVGSFGVWVYAYSGWADRPPPDVLETDTFAVAAKPICDAAVDDLNEIQDASLAESAAERSVDLRAATDRLAAMLDDLEKLDVAGESNRDSELRDEWITNWRILIEDRYNYADALLVDEDARFLISDIGVSESPERRLSRFATVNKMESCGSPGDAG